MMYVDPRKLALIQEVTRNIKAEIRVNEREGRVSVRFVTEDPRAAQEIPGMVQQLANQMASNLYSYFAMQGEMVYD